MQMFFHRSKMNKTQVIFDFWPSPPLSYISWFIDFILSLIFDQTLTLFFTWKKMFVKHSISSLFNVQSVCFVWFASIKNIFFPFFCYIQCLSMIFILFFIWSFVCLFMDMQIFWNAKNQCHRSIDRLNDQIQRYQRSIISWLLAFMSIIVCFGWLSWLVVCNVSLMKSLFFAVVLLLFSVVLQLIILH